MPLSNVVGSDSGALHPNGLGTGNSTWQASKAYAVNDIVIAPASRLLVRCKTAHTAGSSFSIANWEPIGYADYNAYQMPQGIRDYVAGLWATAHPHVAQPSPAVTLLAAGFSLTTELGASFQEWAWNATPPVRKIGILGASIAVASTTVEGNYGLGSGAVGGRNPYALEFDTDATALVLPYRGNSTSPAYPGIGITIDGHPVSRNYFRDTGGVTNAINAVKVVFPDDRVKRVRLDLQYIDWRSIAVPAGATIAAASYTPARKKIGVLGNSWIQGYVNHTTDPHSIAPTLCRLLGGDYINFGIGGTGYLNAGSASVFGSTTRLDAIQTLAPDLLVVFGAQNDDGLSGLQAAATQLYSDIATRLPSTKIIVVGPESVNYNSISSRATNVTALKAAVAAASNVLFGDIIDPYTEKWITGSGRIGTINGDGIADYMMQSDAIHPTPFGAAYYARRIMENIVWQALRAGKMTGAGFSLDDLLA